jgi:hypothetical protein
MGKPRQPSLQKYLKALNPEAKSAVMKKAVDAILQIQKSSGNPHPINAIGMQNLMNMIMSFAAAFGSPQKAKEDELDEILRRIIEFIRRILALLQQIRINAANGHPDSQLTPELKREIRAFQREILKFANQFGGIEQLFLKAQTYGLDLRGPYHELFDQIGE